MRKDDDGAHNYKTVRQTRPPSFVKFNHTSSYLKGDEVIVDEKKQSSLRFFHLANHTQQRERRNNVFSQSARHQICFNRDG